MTLVSISEEVSSCIVYLEVFVQSGTCRGLAPGRLMWFAATL